MTFQSTCHMAAVPAVGVPSTEQPLMSTYYELTRKVVTWAVDWVA